MPILPIPYFDGALLEVDDADDANGSALAEAEVGEALSRFLALGPQNRLADSRHLVAYYLDFREAIGSPSWLDQEIGNLTDPAAIWNHISPRSIFLRSGGTEDRQCYVVLEGECDWEGRGLMMVWQNGNVLCKAGGYDGHVTNARAYGDPSLERVVYRGSDLRFRTFIDR